MEQNQDRDFHRHVPFSKSYPEIERTWSIAKLRGRKSFDRWCYIVLVLHCVSFSSKSKAINVFSKHILKSETRDQSNRAGKKLFCHVLSRKELFEQRFVKVFDQNWKHMEARNQRTGTPADFLVHWQACQKQPPEVLYKKTIPKNFAKTFRPATLLKRDPSTDIFLWMLQNF